MKLFLVKKLIKRFFIHLSNTSNSLLATKYTQWYIEYILQAFNMYFDNNRGENNLDGSKNDLERVVSNHIQYTYLLILMCIYYMCVCEYV